MLESTDTLPAVLGNKSLEEFLEVFEDFFEKKMFVGVYSELLCGISEEIARDICGGIPAGISKGGGNPGEFHKKKQILADPLN